jgi:hypothetical protein
MIYSEGMVGPMWSGTETKRLLAAVWKSKDLFGVAATFTVKFIKNFSGAPPGRLMIALFGG